MTYVIQFLVFVLCIVPLSLLIHECGHALSAKVFHANKILISIGVGKKLWETETNTFHICLRLFPFLNSYSLTERQAPFNRFEKIVITLMGPVMNGVVSTILLFLYMYTTQHTLLLLAILFNGWLLFINLLPFKLKQKESDGYTIYSLICK